MMLNQYFKKDRQPYKKGNFVLVKNRTDHTVYWPAANANMIDKPLT